LIGNISGKVIYLRAHDVGSAYGPPNDQIDAEVIVKLDSDPSSAYGFQLRQDDKLPARQGMFQLLMDAFQNSWTVHIDWQADANAKNRIAFRVWITK
jgi:hypothetical protein